MTMDLLKLRNAYERMDDLQRTADEIRIARTLRDARSDVRRTATPAPAPVRPSTSGSTRRAGGCPDDLTSPRPA
jgi:hypothetical protein